MTATYSPAQMSGFGGSPWDRAVPAQNDDADQSYNAPREQFRSLKSHQNSEYYHTGFDSKRSSSGRGSLSSDSGRKRSIGSGMNEEMVDDSAWIHRDKLAQIETQEMQEAGLRVRRISSRSARSRSRSATRTASRNSERRGRDSNQPATRSQSDAGLNSTGVHNYDDMHDLTVPPVPIDSESYSRHNSGLIETSGFGFEDVPNQSPRIRSSSRPGTSRIPVSRNSPAPLSTAVLERDSPLNRSRNGSLALSSSPEVTQKPKMHRPRSQSLGSHQMLEEAGISEAKAPRSRPVSMHLTNSPLVNNDSTSSSPKIPKSPQPGALNSKKATHTRNASTTKPRVVSGSSMKDSPSSRPKSSHAPPRPIHRPEGEAPWIATMYKPDPMLPPDQQLLPTHAKKLMQERWEAEGASSDVFDKDFKPLREMTIPPAKPKLKKQVSFDGSEPHIIPNKVSEDDGERFPAAWTPTTDPIEARMGKNNRLSMAFNPAGDASVGKSNRLSMVYNNNGPASPGRNVTRPNVALNPVGDATVATVGENKKNNRTSVYRLQTTRALPREDRVREQAQGVAELEAHGAHPQLQPPRHQPQDPEKKEEQEEKVVHKVDLEGLRRQKKEEKEKEEKEAGCCACVIM
ncbi:Hypothetical protein D9617_2g058060 [Elsinoe fawcettii]|nr:Hypothetical protein D9617_2g058060 [Elsinoe fawcettii]